MKEDFDVLKVFPTTFSRYTIPKVERRLPFVEVGAALVASFSFFCSGIVQSYTSPAIYSIESDGESNITLGRNDILWIASSPSLASFFGTILAAPLLEFCGRQKSLVVTTIPSLLGWLVIGLSVNIGMIHAGRILTGLAMGMAKAAAPIYVSEISRASWRGLLGTLPPMLNAAGILLGLYVGCEISWRLLALIISAFPLLLLLLTVWLPESPLWLTLHGEEGKAFKSLESLRGQGRKVMVQDEMDEMKCSVEEMNFSNKRFCWRDFISRKENYLGFSLMIFQQLSGVSAVVYYLTIILTETSSSRKGVGGKVPRSVEQETAAISIGIVHFLAFFVSLPLIDRVGRRVLLMVSGVLMALSHSTLAIFLYFHLQPNEPFVQITSAWLPLTSLCVFIAAFSIGFGPVPYIFITEAFSLKFRSYLCSMATLISQIASFSVLQLFPVLLKIIPPYTIFIMFSAVCAISVIFVHLLIPETKGKSLGDLEKYFRKERETLLDDMEENENPTIYIH